MEGLFIRQPEGQPPGGQRHALLFTHIVITVGPCFAPGRGDLKGKVVDVAAVVSLASYPGVLGGHIGECYNPESTLPVFMDLKVLGIGDFQWNSLERKKDFSALFLVGCRLQ